MRGEKIGARPKAERMVNQKSVVYVLSCDICNAAGYTAGHLHQCIAVHKHSPIGKHFLEATVKNIVWIRANFAFWEWPRKVWLPYYWRDEEKTPQA